MDDDHVSNVFSCFLHSCQRMAFFPNRSPSVFHLMFPFGSRNIMRYPICHAFSHLSSSSRAPTPPPNRPQPSSSPRPDPTSSTSASRSWARPRPARPITGPLPASRHPPSLHQIAPSPRLAPLPRHHLMVPTRFPSPAVSTPAGPGTWTPAAISPARTAGRHIYYTTAIALKLAR